MRRTRGVDARSPRSAHAACLVALCAGLCAPIGRPAIAQNDDPGAAVIDEVAIDGRTFADVAFTDEPRSADTIIRSQRAWAWAEGSTRRLLLDGDVRIRVGLREFTADKAVVWMESVVGAAPNTRQFAFYFQNVRDPGGPGDKAVHADRLLVTGVITGELTLTTDLLERERPRDTFLKKGEERLAKYLRDLVSPPPPPMPPPEPPPFRHAAPTETPPREARTPATPTDTPAAPRAPAHTPAAEPPIRAERPARAPFTPPPQDPTLPPARRAAPILAREGVVSFHAPERSLVTGKDENALIVSGGVIVQYVDHQRARSLQISAERAVVFLDPRTIADTLRVGPGDVRGVYLEGNVVATDGSYTLRGSRVYYDLAGDRAILLDAVFWAYDRRRAAPIYVRAKAIRQEAEGQWSAERVRLANTSFAEPHLSLGAEHVTITRRRSEPPDDERAETTDAPSEGFVADARGGVFRVGDLPVLPLPRYKGDLTNVPLKSIDVGSRDGRPIVQTRWDLITLLGAEPPDGFTADLLVDGYFGRGPAVGADLDWTSPDADGSLFGYLIYDDGRDKLSSGARIDQENELRGMALFEHMWRMNENWSLFLEGAYISDETFVDAFFPSLAATRREFTNSIYLRRRDERSVFSLETRGTFHDYISNQYLLQSQGFQVQRLPEATYSRVHDSFFDGLFTLSSESSLSRLSMRFSESELADIGFDTPARAMAGFGLSPTDSLADRLRAEGFSEDTITRFDTRHEISLPFAIDSLRISPFAVGRFTAYDDDFDDFAPNEDDRVRLHGSLGVRLWTSFHRIDDSVESSLFDLHRMRHIVEPSLTLWHGETTRPHGTLPVYDMRVEDIASGTALRAGVSNTWQTERGGPGQWRTVDWLVIRTDYVWSSSDTDERSPIGRWFESRPELSNLGEFFTTDVVWQTTDAIAMSVNAIYDFNEHEFSRVSAGALLDHGAGLTSFIEVIHLDARDTTYIDAGARWDASRRYSFAVNTVYDVDDDVFRTVSFDVERRFPQWSVDVTIARDRFRDDTVLAVRLRPTGAGGLTSRVGAPALRSGYDERGGTFSAWPIGD